MSAPVELAAFVQRRSVGMPPDLTPAMANVRAPENISPHNAPDPIRQSDFVSQGRPFGFPARQQIATSFNINGILSVMRDSFAIYAYAPMHIASRPHGNGQPWRERSNIATPAAQAYGSLFTLNADPTGAY